MIEAPFREEMIRLQADYERPTGGLFDIGVGYMFHPRIGFGLNLAGTAHESEAKVSISVPHPFLFDRLATDVATTDQRLWWEEAAVNLHVMVKLTPLDSRFVARVFGGPTYFAVKQEAVSDFSVTETLDLATAAYTVNLSDYEYADSEGSGWGFHLGADVDYFFTSHVGLGGTFRFNRGTVDLDDPLLREVDEIDRDVKVGGAQIGGGLRLKF
jgi:hypothetical protein